MLKKKDLIKNTVLKRAFSYLSKYIGAFLLIIIILCVAFWIRVQGVDTIPDGQFTSNDAYLYYRQAQIVSEQGHLPARDMDRWLPIGRDNRQILPLYAYVVAYAHKAIKVFSPNISLYQVMLYLPPFFFVIGLGALCLFLYRVFGLLFSATTGVLIATMPSMIARSAAGFSDRDSWCIMLGILAVIIYLVTLRMQNSRKRVIYTLASGAICFLGGHSWEGFGVFVSIILFVEIYRFITTEINEDLKHYLLWVSAFVPTLFLTSHPYRSGEWFAQHLFAFMLMPPLVLLLIRYIRHYLITKSAIAIKLRPHARTLALVLTLISFTVGILYALSQLDTFSLTTVPLNKSFLMETVGELSAPSYERWVFGFGSIFFLGCIGLIVTCIHLWNKKGLILTFSIVLFSASTFFRDYIDNLLGFSLGNILFFLSIACAVFGLLLIAWLHKQQDQHEYYFVAFTIWYLYWIALSRDAMRYEFFIGISIAFFTAALLKYILDSICVKLNVQKVFQLYIKTGMTVALLAVLLFWTPAGAHAKRSVFAVKHALISTPGHTSIERTFRWMKSHLQDTDCVAANWSHGSQLNVLGGVKTIIDQDHYIQYWIHMFYKYVCTTQSDSEAIEFLKTHGVSHLMLTSEDMLQLEVIQASVDGKSFNNQILQGMPLNISKYENGQSFLFPIYRDAPFTHIDINQKSEDNSFITTTAILKNGTTIDMPNISFKEKSRIDSQNYQKRTEKNTGGILLYFNDKIQLLDGYYIPPTIWKSLSVRLFFRGESSETFVPIYPEDGDASAEVKVWKINYPPDVKSNPKYLETKPPEQ